MSSKNTSTKRRRKGLRTSFIIAWKVDGAFVRPNAMTKNSKWPWWVRKAVFSTSAGCMRTWKYPLRKSILLKNLAPLDLVEELVTDRDGKLVFYRAFVETAVVDTKTP